MRMTWVVPGVMVVVAMADALAGEISGTVVDAQGNPISGAVVHYIYQSGNFQLQAAPVRADKAGGFVLKNLHSGYYLIYVKPKGQAKTESMGMLVMSTQLEESQSITGARLIYQPQNALSIGGRITDTEGRPVAHLKIVALGSSFANAETDKDGRYKLTGLPEGNYVIMGRMGDDEVIPHRFTPAGKQDADFVVRISERSALPWQFACIVSDAATNKPLGEFYVGRIGKSGALPTAPVFDKKEVVRDPEGKFKEFKKDEGTYTWYFWADGYAAEACTATFPAPAGAPNVYAVALKPAATLEGRVVDAAGSPVAGAHILPDSEAFQYLNTLGLSYAVTNEKGLFTCRSLPLGPARLIAVHPEFGETRAAANLQAGARANITFKMAGGGYLHGAITYGGAPAVPARFLFNSQGKNKVTNDYDPTRFPDGKFKIGPLPTGACCITVTLDVQAAGGIRRHIFMKNPSVESGQDKAVNFDFTAGDCTLHGNVTLDGARPVSTGAEFFYPREEGSEFIALLIGPSGAYHLTDLPAGKCGLTLHASNMELPLPQSSFTEYTTYPVFCKTQSLTLEPGQTVQVDYEIDSAEGRPRVSSPPPDR